MTGAGFDPPGLLAELNRHDVDYLLIGGLAVVAHGHLRATGDVDIHPRPDAENCRALAAALGDLDAGLAGVDAHLLGIELDAATLAEGANFTLTTRLGDLDVMQDLPGARPYAAMSADAVAIEVSGVPVRVVGYADLRALKRATDRPRDREDLRVLDAIADSDS